MIKAKNCMKRALSVLLTFMLVFAFTACDGGKNNGKTVDPTKTQFYIANYNGGYGHAWLDEAVKIFENKFAEEEFEPGKKGVQIWVTNQKDEITGWNLFSTIATLEQDLFLTETPRREITSGNLIKPLDGIIDEPLTEFGEDKSILDKLMPYYKELNIDPVLSRGGSVLYLPYSEAYFGVLSYDIDLFEEKQYFIKDGGGWTGADNKSAGLDGEKGTFDDGLPVNETEFFALCDRILSRGDIPVTFAGQYAAYMNAMVTNMFFNYDDGYSQYMCLKLQGEYDMPDGSKIVFDGKNFYEAQRLPGKLKALEIAERLINNTDYYSGEAFKSTQSHIEAQDEFLTSVLADDRVAMIIEGTWWENEASDTFARMSKTSSAYSRENRRIGLMPVFRTSDKAQKTTLLAVSMATFINANVSPVKETIAKKFIRFMFTDEILELFTRITGTASAYRYKISDDTYDSLSTFGKMLWDIHTDDKDRYVFSSDMAIDNAPYLKDNGNYPQGFESNVSSGENSLIGTTIPFSFFRFNTDKFEGKSKAEAYFEGMYKLAVNRYNRYYAETYGAIEQ